MGGEEGSKREGEGGRTETKLERQDLVALWGQALGGKAMAARLSAMVPYTKGQKRKVKKHMLKGIAGKLAASKNKKDKKKPIN